MAISSIVHVFTEWTANSGKKSETDFSAGFIMRLPAGKAMRLNPVFTRFCAVDRLDAGWDKEGSFLGARE